MTENGNPVIDEKKAPFHPHLHIIAVVKPSYFGRDYIKRIEYQEMWMKAMRLDYLPYVDVRKIYFKLDNTSNLEEDVKQEPHDVVDKEFKGSGVFEISKYIAKATDYLKDKDMFRIFYKATYKRRNWTFTGLCTKLHRLYQADELLIEEMKDNQEKEIVEIFDYLVTYSYLGTKKNYYMTRIIEINK